ISSLRWARRWKTPTTVRHRFATTHGATQSAARSFPTMPTRPRPGAGTSASTTRASSFLIEQILASHSQAEGTMELPELTTLTGELRRQAARGAEMPYHHVLAALDSEALRALGERYLAVTRIQRKTGKPFFIDKMPNNFMHVGLIHLILPNAK